jgi:hypothetical protein
LARARQTLIQKKAVSMAIWKSGGSGDRVEKTAAPRMDERARRHRCARCRSEHVRELGAASSNLMWLACVDCSYVWMVRFPASAD